MYEYCIVDSKFGHWWPETFSEGQEEHLFGDLEYLRRTHPQNKFFVERREVGTWGRWDIHSEMVS